MTDALGSTLDTSAASTDEAAVAAPEALAAGMEAVQLAEGAVDVPLPQPGETVGIRVAAGQTLHFLFDPAAATGGQDGSNVILEINGGEVVLEGFEGAASGEAPVEITNADGTVINLADFLVALDLSPEAGTQPAAGAAGPLPEATAPNQGAGFTPGQAPTILASLNPDGPVDPTALQYGLSEREPTLFDLVGEADAAGGALDSTVTTTIDGGEGNNGYEFEDPNAVSGTFSGGFEDWQPNQHTGDSSISPMKLTVTLVPVDNEEIVSVTINNIPDGVTIWAPGQTVVGDGTNSITILAVDLNNVWVQPVGNTDGDIVLDLSAQILDPDSGLTSDITGSVTAVVDAVADQPWDVSGDAPAQVGIGTDVTFDVQAQFGDWSDGSENQFLLVELPEGWGNPNGYETETFAAGNSWGIPAGTYVVVDVTGAVDTGTGLGTASITLEAPAALPEGVGSETFYFGVVAKTVDTAGDGELTGVNNVSYTPIGASTEIPEIPVTVVKPYLTIDDVTVDEDAGTATFTVTLNGATGVAVGFSYATADGSAFDGDGETGIGIPDYSATSGSLSFPASNDATQTLTITVPIADDAVFEDTEQFVVNLSGVDGTVVNLPASDVQGVGTILDDGQAPTVEVADGAPDPQTEGEGHTITFTVKLSGPTDKAVTVDFTTNDGSAQAGYDYETLSSQLTFAPGETEKTVTVTVLNDAVFEDPEAFTLDISNADRDGAALTITDSSGEGHIVDDEAAPTVLVTDGEPDPQTEGDGHTITFTVKLSGPTDKAVTVDFTTNDGSAQAGYDYEALSGQLTFAPGETEKTVTITVLNDAIFEDLEAFTLDISNADRDGAALTITDDSGDGDIVDDEAAPTVLITDGTPNPQIESDGATVTFTVSLSGATDKPVTVDFATVNGAAQAGTDFVFQDGTLTFAPGETTKTITVTVLNDEIFETPEAFTVAISNADRDGTALTITDDSGLGNIVDDQAEPVVRISDGAPDPQTEGAGATITFTVTLDGGPADEDTVVTFHTVDGSAVAGDDYVGQTGSITIPAGATSATITIDVLDDAIFETPEAFTVVLDSAELDASNEALTIADDTGVGNIVDDLGEPTLSISDGSPLPQLEPAASGDAPTQVTFTVTLSNPSSQAVTVAYQTVTGTALEGVDFENEAGTLTFAAGETSKTITIDVYGDNIDELLEQFTVELSAPTNATILDGEGVGQIADEDATPSLSISNGSPLPQLEPGTSGDAPTQITFTVTLSNPSSQAVTVAYQTVTGTALEGIDFENESGLLTFAAGETSKTITVDVYGDNIDELLEQFTVELSAPTNATIADGEGLGQIQDNDPTPVLTIDNVSANEGDPLTFTLSLSNPSSGDIILDLAAGTPGTGTAGVDYETISFEYFDGTNWVAAGGPNGTQVTIPAGSTSMQVRVDSLPDSTDEPDETFTLSATAAVGSAAVDTTDTGIGTILDDDAAPTLAINDVQVTEGDPIAGADDPATFITFTVTKTGDTSQAVTVQYNVVEGSALEPQDYFTDGGANPLSGTITFAAGETSKTITLKITDDLSAESTETFSVVLSNPTNATIADDTGLGTIYDNDINVPDAISEEACVTEGALVNYNLMLILDKSGSMDDDDLDPGPGTLTRLQLAVDALKNMLDAYDAAGGTIQIQIVTFDTDAQGIFPAAGTFYTVDQAKAQLDLIASGGAGGNTDYDDATELAADAFANWPAESAAQKNIAYFLSDGEPNPSSGALDSGEQDAWQDALAAKGVECIAVGVGDGIASTTELAKVAYPADNVILVENDTELSAALLGTLPSILVGNVLDNGDTDGGDGWGSPKIVSLEHDGVLYTTASSEYDPGAQTLTIATDLGGTLTINFQTGQYTYQAPNVNHGSDPDPIETFIYTIQDANGDTDAATLSICIQDGEPIAYDNYAEVTESALVEVTTLEEGFESTSGWSKVGNAVQSSSHETQGSHSAVMSTGDGANWYDPDPVNFSNLATGLGLTTTQIQNLLGNGSSNEGKEGSGVAKTFTVDTSSTSIDIAFDWYFDAGGNSSSGNDAAVYFIKVDGIVVASDVLGRRTDGDTGGTEEVTLTVTPGSHTVELIWAAIDVKNGSDTSKLYVDNVSMTDVVLTENTVTGNVLSDPNTDPFSSDPFGARDDMGSDGATLTRVDYVNASGDPAFALVPVSGSMVTVETQNGYLTIDKSGAYSYAAKLDAVTGGATDQDVFTYTLTDGDGDTDTAHLTIDLHDAVLPEPPEPPSILSGTIITNTNVSNQPVRLTITQLGNALNSFSTILILDSQGQQSSTLNFAVDVGFDIDNTQQYLVTLTSTNGEKVNVTDFTLEGVTIEDASGNIQLAFPSTGDGMTQVIQPNTAGTGGIPGSDTDVVYSDDTAPFAAGPTTAQAQAGASVPYLYGTDGDDSLTGSAGVDVIAGGAGNDTIHGDGETDVLFGDAGDDQLFGDAGDDALFGGAGSNTLIGGLGADRIDVSEGSDLVVYQSTLDGADLIAGFGTSGTDQDFVSLDTLFDSLNGGIDAAGRASRVQLVQNGDDVTVNIDVSAGTGAGDGSSYVTLATIQSVSVSDLSVGTGPTDDIQVGTF